ncbi:Glycine cleavage system H protein, mitochondrial [Stylophora pistillata]|uniref:Glycine cleavage system H protein n=1 Tax=Stylophora pistillata TaxID=50429 RepID=A0A2B4ST97_STYPI|nr:Glycine cleavage system H protein, mitochondrial [Stylophora pistillata]
MLAMKAARNIKPTCGHAHGCSSAGKLESEPRASQITQFVPAVEDGYFSDRKYTKKHEWISVDNGIGLIGVTDYAQKELGEVVYAQLPEVGDTFNIGDEIGALESVKAAADIYSPANGEVSEINSELEGSPGLVNESPYDKGWLVKMKVEELADDLLSEEEYHDLVKSIDH